MSSARRATLTTSADVEAGLPLELAPNVRGRQLERRVLATTLRLLAAWLTQQAQLLSPAGDAEYLATVAAHGNAASAVRGATGSAIHGSLAISSGPAIHRGPPIPSGSAIHRGSPMPSGPAIHSGSAVQAESAPGNLRKLPARARPNASVLTRRERDVVVRIAGGFSNRQIGADLVITVGTAERHVANILNKLDMRSRAEVAAWVVESGLHDAQQTLHDERAASYSRQHR
jgi:DNA-binding CsgD family transcriptional regulator